MRSTIVSTSLRRVSSVSRRITIPAPIASPKSIPSARLRVLRGLTGLNGSLAGLITDTVTALEVVSPVLMRSIASTSDPRWEHAKFEMLAA